MKYTLHHNQNAQPQPKPLAQKPQQENTADQTAPETERPNLFKTKQELGKYGIEGLLFKLGGIKDNIKWKLQTMTAWQKVKLFGKMAIGLALTAYTCNFVSNANKAGDRNNGRSQLKEIKIDKPPQMLRKGLAEKGVEKNGQYNVIKDVWESKVTLIEKDTLTGDEETEYFWEIDKQEIDKALAGKPHSVSEKDLDNTSVFQFVDDAVFVTSYKHYKKENSGQSNDMTGVSETLDETFSQGVGGTQGAMRYSKEAVASEKFQKFLGNGTKIMFLREVSEDDFKKKATYVNNLE